jgi:hypothetical protein
LPLDCVPDVAKADQFIKRESVYFERYCRQTEHRADQPALLADGLRAIDAV